VIARLSAPCAERYWESRFLSYSGAVIQSFDDDDDDDDVDDDGDRMISFDMFEVFA
jgi:hypothetical protein